MKHEILIPHTIKSFSDSVCSLSDTRESDVHEPAVGAKRVMMGMTDRHFEITAEMIRNDTGGVLDRLPFR